MNRPNNPLVNDIRTPNAPPVRRLRVGKTATAISTGSSLSLSWKVPDGYNRIAGIEFNPDGGREIIFSVYSENVAGNIVQNCTTAIGTAMGYMNPDHRYAERDQITLTGSAQNITGGPASITFNMVFEYVDPNER